MISRKSRGDFEVTVECKELFDASGQHVDVRKVADSREFREHVQERSHRPKPEIDERLQYAREYADYLERFCGGKFETRWPGSYHGGGDLLDFMESRYEAEITTEGTPSPHGEPGDLASAWFWSSEMNRVSGHYAQAAVRIERACDWILQTSSPEHLVWLHLAQARLANEQRNLAEAGSALYEGLDIAERCRFRLAWVDLLNEQACMYIFAADFENAASSAEAAREIASSEGCRYAWGHALAIHYLSDALSAQGHDEEVDRMAEWSRRSAVHLELSPVLRSLRVES